jgi:murein DD-endopeptidase MepM/ murein hydrolase activator NlpD
MSSCCPPTPASSAIGAAFSEASGPESDIRLSESVECYIARSGNTTGLHDDATSNVDNKIENSSIPLTRSSTQVSINTTFKLTAGSSRTASTWSMTISPASSILSLSSSGVLTGTWLVNNPELGTIFKIKITANDGTDIDTRGFTVSPSIGKNDEIKLISPLPGGIVNSKFGPRLHPIQNVMKAHTGIDMKMADRSVKDVVSAADGEVVLSGGNPSTGYGIRVHIKHLTNDGQYLCNTTYNHLSKVYVKIGQKVMAGQAIGLEGSTGSSTGNHLHFEVKLPDGKFIDPEPLINGKLLVANSTAPNGDAQGVLELKNSSASLSINEAKARQKSCEVFGPTYPAATPPETTDPTPMPVIPNDDAFERAWFFTMKYEVGPFWSTEPQYTPGDAELDAGLVQTKQQRKKVGYVNTPNYPGGETKFGVAQKPNPTIKVLTANYAQAKNIGFNNYWKSFRSACNNKGSLVAIMLFDMNYLHGDGNAKKMYQNSGVVSNTTDLYNKQLIDAEALYNARLTFIRKIPRPEFTKGWLNRATACLQYIKTLPPPY